MVTFSNSLNDLSLKIRMSGSTLKILPFELWSHFSHKPNLVSGVVHVHSSNSFTRKTNLGGKVWKLLEPLVDMSKCIQGNLSFF